MRRTIHIEIKGKIKKGSISFIGNISEYTLGRIMIPIAEDMERVKADREYRREMKKQNKIIEMIN